MVSFCIVGWQKLISEIIGNSFPFHWLSMDTVSGYPGLFINKSAFKILVLWVCCFSSSSQSQDGSRTFLYFSLMLPLSETKTSKPSFLPKNSQFQPTFLHHPNQQRASFYSHLLRLQWLFNRQKEFPPPPESWFNFYFHGILFF